MIDTRFFSPAAGCAENDVDAPRAGDWNQDSLQAVTENRIMFEFSTETSTSVGEGIAPAIGQLVLVDNRVRHRLLNSHDMTGRHDLLGDDLDLGIAAVALLGASGHLKLGRQRGVGRVRSQLWLCPPVK